MWFLYFINFLTWLGTFSLVGLAIYLHHFTRSPKDVGGLVIGAIIMGWLSIVITGGIAEEINKRRKANERDKDEE